AAEGWQAHRSREVHPGRHHRLQGRRNPPQVHLGAWEDPRPSYHRCVRAGAASDRHGDQERSRDGSPALRRRWPLRGTDMAKLILTNEVAGLGSAGDVVEVRSGYARNYLVPQGYATAWTRGGEKEVASIRAAREARAIHD